MSKGNTGGPAFPPMHDPETHASGMTLRDYFAAKSLPMVNMNNFSTMSGESRPEYIARQAYVIADAMLRKRSHG